MTSPNRLAAIASAACSAFLAVAACGAALVPGSASAAPAMEIAVQDDRVLLAGAGIGREAGLDLARELNASWIRVNVAWRRRPDFRPWDDLVDAAARRGIRVQMALIGAPRWDRSKTAQTDVRRPSPRAFAQFAARVARHFDGRVTRYSVWNEPNWHTWLVPQRTAARQYRALYTSAYRAIKEVNRRNEVLFGELAPHAKRGLSIGPLRFLRDVACVDGRYRRRRDCKPLRTDGVALHPYEFTRPPSFRYPDRDSVTIGTLGRLNRALVSLRRARALVTPRGGVPPVYLTEFGYFASGKRKLPAAKRGRWLRQAFAIASRTPRVRQMLYYQLVQTPRQPWNTGLLDRRGRPDGAFRGLRSWAVGELRRGRLGSPLGQLTLPQRRS